MWCTPQARGLRQELAAAYDGAEGLDGFFQDHLDAVFARERECTAAARQMIDCVMYWLQQFPVYNVSRHDICDGLRSNQTDESDCIHPGPSHSSRSLPPPKTTKTRNEQQLMSSCVKQRNLS